jgi:hypothetical protein
MEAEKPVNTYAQKLAEKRAHVRLIESALWQLYRDSYYSPEQMQAKLRELSQAQTEELPSESYL